MVASPTTTTTGSTFKFIFRTHTTLHYLLKERERERERRYYHIQSISITWRGLAWSILFHCVHSYFPVSRSVERSYESRESELWSRVKIMTFSPGMKFTFFIRKKSLKQTKVGFPHENSVNWNITHLWTICTARKCFTFRNWNWKLEFGNNSVKHFVLD
jgi:hypothetical protein